jgi:hypothetical protein
MSNPTDPKYAQYPAHPPQSTSTEDKVDRLAIRIRIKLRMKEKCRKKQSHYNDKAKHSLMNSYLE